MKLDGRITILINREYTKIEIKDRTSGQTFVNIELTPYQLSQALSKQAFTPCKSMEVSDLERLGKIHQNKTFEFKLPKDDYIKDSKEIAKELACNIGKDS